MWFSIRLYNSKNLTRLGSFHFHLRVLNCTAALSAFMAHSISMEESPRTPRRCSIYLKRTLCGLEKTTLQARWIFATPGVSSESSSSAIKGNDEEEDENLSSRFDDSAGSKNSMVVLNAGLHVFARF